MTIVFIPHTSAIRTSVLCLSLVLTQQMVAQPHVVNTKQGYSMLLNFDNRGVFGRASYPGVWFGIDPGPDSVGLAYPVGQPFEHLFGAGIWVGGKLDTAHIGTSPQIIGVTTGCDDIYPGIEFYPGNLPADTIWKVHGRGVQRPQTWDAYWGDAIPGVSLSDNDHYCTYTDTSVRVTNHIPLRLKVIQSTFAWNDPYAEAIDIVEFKIINVGFKQIDSVYMGFFLEGDVGPYHVPQYVSHNYTAYYPDLRTAYIHNPVDVGSTPVGVALLKASRPLDSLRLAYRWYPISLQMPSTDPERYAIINSGIIQPDEFPSVSDTRCVLSCGPFTMRPRTEPAPDTVLVAFALLSGQSLSALRQHAAHARVLYLNGGLPASVQPRGSGTPETFELFQNFPNPFNPTTTIRYSLPKASFVTLTVTNTLGQDVAQLVDDQQRAGYHEAVFRGDGLASGVYFCLIRAGDFTATGKMLMVK